MPNTYRWPNGDDAVSHLTTQQVVALDKIVARHALESPVTVYPDYGSKAVLVRAAGMVIGVEPDGYAHT